MPGSCHPHNICIAPSPTPAVHGPGYSLAHAAALLGLPGTLRLLLRSAGPAAAGAQAEGGYSPVLAAAASGCIASLELLSCAAPWTLTQPPGNVWSALHAAAGCAHLPTVEWLLAAAPSLAAATADDGQTPLHAAADRGDAAIVRAILAAAPEAATAADACGCLLHAAAAFGRTQAAALLLAAAPQAAVARTVDGETPLQLALARLRCSARGRSDYAATARLLVAAGTGTSALRALAAAGPPALPLFPHAAAAHVPLTAKSGRWCRRAARGWRVRCVPHSGARRSRRSSWWRASLAATRSACARRRCAWHVRSAPRTPRCLLRFCSTFFAWPLAADCVRRPMSNSFVVHCPIPGRQWLVVPCVLPVPLPCAPYRLPVHHTAPCRPPLVCSPYGRGQLYPAVPCTPSASPQDGRRDGQRRPSWAAGRCRLEGPPLPPAPHAASRLL